MTSSSDSIESSSIRAPSIESKESEKKVDVLAIFTDPTSSSASKVNQVWEGLNLSNVSFGPAEESESIFPQRAQVIEPKDIADEILARGGSREESLGQEIVWPGPKSKVREAPKSENSSIEVSGEEILLRKNPSNLPKLSHESSKEGSLGEIFDSEVRNADTRFVSGEGPDEVYDDSQGKSRSSRESSTSGEEETTSEYDSAPSGSESVSDSSESFESSEPSDIESSEEDSDALTPTPGSSQAPTDPAAEKTPAGVAKTVMGYAIPIIATLGFAACIAAIPFTAGLSVFIPGIIATSLVAGGFYYATSVAISDYDIGELQGRIHKLENELKDVKADRDKYLPALDKLEKELKEVDEEIAIEEAKTTPDPAKITELRDKKTALEKHIEAEKEKIAEKDSRVDDLQAQLEKLEGELAREDARHSKFLDLQKLDQEIRELEAERMKITVSLIAEKDSEEFAKAIARGKELLAEIEVKKATLEELRAEIIKENRAYSEELKASERSSAPDEGSSEEGAASRSESEVSLMSKQPSGRSSSSREPKVEELSTEEGS